jgi:hypothetical protein
MNETLSSYYSTLGNNLFMKMVEIYYGKQREELLVCRFISTAAWLMIRNNTKTEMYRKLAMEIGALVDETGTQFDVEDLYFQVNITNFNIIIHNTYITHIYIYLLI